MYISGQVVSPPRAVLLPACLRRTLPVHYSYVALTRGRTSVIPGITFASAVAVIRYEGVNTRFIKPFAAPSLLVGLLEGFLPAYDPRMVTMLLMYNTSWHLVQAVQGCIPCIAQQ